MGLFDAIAGQAASALSQAGGSGHAGLMDALTGLINGAHSGGLQGLVTAFREQGLADTVNSWIGTGQNLPISGDQLQSVLGSEQVQAIAQKLGMSPGDASQALAGLLPQVVDHLTPNGQLPENHLVEQGLAMFRSLGART